MRFSQKEFDEDRFDPDSPVGLALSQEVGSSTPIDGGKRPLEDFSVGDGSGHAGPRETTGIID